jgi:hypothetical protein
MPYRRLPNTDSARLRAMKIALEKGKELPPYKMAYSSKTVSSLSLSIVFSFTGSQLLPRIRKAKIIMRWKRRQRFT